MLIGYTFLSQNSSNFLSNMEVLWCSLLLIFSIFFLIPKYFHARRKKLPPSPPSLPILGHLHLLKPPFHRTFQHLCNKYGPMIYLRFGIRPTLVVSSASIAEECFSKNDIIFANRPHSRAAELLTYNYTAMGFAPYGDHWRNLRRVTTVQILSSASLNHFSPVRNEEIRFIAQKLFLNSRETRCKVNLKSLFFEFVFNVIMKMFAGRRWTKPPDLFDAEVPPSVCDYIPALRWIGFGKFEEKLVISRHKKRDKLLQDMIDESRRNEVGSSSSGEQSKTIIQSLLSLQEAEPEYYTDDIIKGIIMVIFTAGTATAALTMEWVMTLLLNHPQVMEKLRSEIDHHVISGNFIEDSDLSKLPYLRCIINETMRLFPVTPLLLPHFSSEDCTINGFNIPRGTTLLVNAWAIHRDPNLWDQPNDFKPERFEGIKTTEFEGFKYLPFGMGRRACPGSALAIRLVGLAVGTLVQCFEWERIGSELVDLDEAAGLALPKLHPLEAFCRLRPPASCLFS